MFQLAQWFREYRPIPEDALLHQLGVGFALATGVILLLGVFWKFGQYFRRRLEEPGQLKVREKHPIATLSMTAFVLMLFPFLVNSIGAIDTQVFERTAFFSFGLIVVLISTAFHLRSKWDIGSNWSDGIEADKTHRIVTDGSYGIERHPMYSSLILWCFGCAIMFRNPLVFAFIAFLFVPMMIVRAQAEERLLDRRCEDRAGYRIYRERIRLLRPRFGGSVAMLLRIIGIVYYAAFIVRFTGGNFSPEAVVFLLLLHLSLGFTILPEKAAFSYKSKSGMLVLVYCLAMLWQPFFYLNWLFWFMYVYGLVFNCPCMFLYEKYNGCPCFGYLKRACSIKRN